MTDENSVLLFEQQITQRGMGTQAHLTHITTKCDGIDLLSIWFGVFFSFLLFERREQK